VWSFVVLFLSCVSVCVTCFSLTYSCHTQGNQAEYVIHSHISAPQQYVNVMQMLLLTAATSFEHRGAQCLLTLTRSISPPLDQFPVRVCSCPLCIINRL